MSANSEIDALANFIMTEVPGEPSQSDGAGGTAIRIIRTQQVRIEELETDLSGISECFVAYMVAGGVSEPHARQRIASMRMPGHDRPD